MKWNFLSQSFCFGVLGYEGFDGLGELCSDDSKVVFLPFVPILAACHIVTSGFAVSA